VKKPWFNKSSPAITPKSYTDLLVLAKQGIEQYWSRDGSRPNGIGQNINTMQGAYSVKVTADLTGSPKARSFKLIENLKTEYERSTSIPLISCIVHNAGFHSPNAVDQMFEVTAAHEFGHLILNAYGGGGFWKGYSSTHKGTTTWADQKAIPGNYIPLAGEIDLMHYQEKRPLNSTPQDPSLQNQRNRAVAAEQDVNSLLWLCRVRFND
jgi:hypothetical protein